MRPGAPQRDFDDCMALARELLATSGHEAGGDLYEASDAVNAAIRLRPGNADAWLLKCQIMSALEDDPAALAAAEMALRRAPRRSEAHYFRASVLADMERFPEALRAIERAFRNLGVQGPGSDDWLLEDLYYEKAALLSALSREDEALSTFEEGLRRCPGSTILRSALEPLRRSRVRARLTVLDGGKRS